ncbi:unnamed protein product [Sphagnum jensenii]|uniref:DUF7950 domain-containing protein n=1 Tax=Sphagnum jensenii TaxID=128206 RepID=A0ABP1ADX2_9BRYO
MYAGTPTFPSKTQHIMSRYRPIAPKPLAPKPEGTDPSDPQTSSSLSLDKGSSKLSGSKGRRSRKRQTDSSSGSTRNTKKASVAAPEKRLVGTTSKSPVTPTSKRNEPGSPKEVAVELTPILSESVAPVFGPASFDTSMVPKDSVVYEGDLSLGLSPHKVIAPQPIRAVGSTIFLECITKVNQLASPMLGTVEAFQDQLEKLLLPTVITDLRHRVRWVNTAYKQMVGQPEFAWLSSTVGGNSEPEAPSQTRLAGDVSLVCAGEQPPVDAAEFSCQVRIQWTKGGGENSSLGCPVDVIRLDEDSSGPLFVWKFDIFNG